MSAEKFKCHAVKRTNRRIVPGGNVQVMRRCAAAVNL